MKKVIYAAVLAALISVVMATPALAHVTVQPNEALAESFARFVVRVPNERDDAGTTRVEVRFPPLASVSFQDTPGWERRVKMKKLDEPIEAFGEELTEAVGTVTWSGSSIQPGEFAEFGFSALMPAGEEELRFAAIQTYDSGEVVRWIGPEDADEPAALVHTIELGALGEGVGELGALHEAVHEIEEMSAQLEELTAQVGEVNDGAAAAPASETDDDSDSTGLILGAVGIGLGLVALAVALARRRA